MTDDGEDVACHSINQHKGITAHMISLPHPAISAHSVQISALVVISKQRMTTCASSLYCTIKKQKMLEQHFSLLSVAPYPQFATHSRATVISLVHQHGS